MLLIKGLYINFCQSCEEMKLGNCAPALQKFQRICKLEVFLWLLKSVKFSSFQFQFPSFPLIYQCVVLVLVYLCLSEA